MQLDIEEFSLSGAEKAAVLFLCIGEERGSALMKKMARSEIQAVIQAMSRLGTIPASVVETVIRDFSETVSGGAGVEGSVQIAERMLSGFMTDDAVTDILGDLRSPTHGQNVWDALAAVNEQTIATWLSGEHDQTIAAIMSRMKPAVSARVLPLFGAERMTEITTRMIGLGSLSRSVLENLESVIVTDFLSTATRKSNLDPHQRLADMFNKMDAGAFEGLSANLEQRIPAELEEIKKKMFTFDDMIKLDGGALQRIMRLAEGNTLALALRGAKADVREAFMSALTQRMREMLETEMKEMGPVRARETREAQAALIDITNDLVSQEVIRLPSTEDEMIED
ncbi:flagellar motor switch protein FliG [Neptunicoccus cionae]|uniref:flagellar motor switch protein FliG n=1 Tax=Neptunicoccus cionae TaxID=2035344 RepID=UPI000C78E89C|nr:flagellar motor switch protein FliG [Amylibacter cionae]MBR9862827.1 flagellar motor switch protein FliG [Paracoccaceae bacterium]PLS21162.1 flagellar motor protein [Amylibacter cionae]